MLRVLVSLAMVGSLAIDAPASAQDADVLFEEGVILIQDGRYADAEVRLRSAMRLAASPRIAYNLTTALIALGRLVEAKEILERVSADPETDSVARSAARARLDELRPRLAWLRVIAPRSAHVTVDQAPIAPEALEGRIAVDPGRHRVALTDRGGSILAIREAYVGEGQVTEVQLEASSVAVLAVQPPDVGGRERERADDPVRDDDGHDEGGTIFGKWWFWTGVAIVAAGATVAVISATDLGARDPAVGTAGAVTLGGGR